MRRPKVICHMMSSVDGRLLTARWTKPFSGTDFKQYVEMYENAGGQFNASAWMIGRNTAQQDFDTGSFDYEKYEPAKRFETHIGSRTSAVSAIILDPNGKTSYNGSNLAGDNIIAVLGETVSQQYLAHLQKNGISYLFAGSDGMDLHKAMEVLYRDFALETILLEGGGIINGAFLKAGLIDELSIMLYPGIDGLGCIPAIIDHNGEIGELPGQGQTLEYRSAEVLEDGLVWLRYKVHQFKN
ncbi:MAG: dihydrofolate reductase family protein [Flavobacterium nitrogenifigens]|uniref:dihydrofolate reductase family protein n=1 Tax=Flavobacterium nitrogenifigens TaxID=1617283 RepID=UPI0028094D73|nr:dihydrofolate reductase family protein [Flavobacterium nitrogenifigens]MDQ8014568.1 dihydrofolate reductase family protein [Flavobacterium nitrogenifigens]